MDGLQSVGAGSLELGMGGCGDPSKKAFSSPSSTADLTDPLCWSTLIKDIHVW